MRPRVAVLRGDGIGPEVIAPALESLPQGIETVEIAAGAQRYLATGEVLSDGELEQMRGCDAILLGAVGDPRVGDGILERGILLRLRRELDLYVNLRPVPELDLVFVRENTEGLYAGVALREADSAFETSVNTTRAIERCARYAFRLAGERRGLVTLVHKTNVLAAAGSLWRETTERVAADHPGIRLAYEHVDAAGYHLVTEPSRFDVILTDNLFGDVLSDVAAGVSPGGLGRAASANLHPAPGTRPGRCLGLFEPVHGSAPDIAGKGLADPTAAIEAARMLTATLERELATR